MSQCTGSWYLSRASVNIPPRRCDKCIEATDDLAHRRNLVWDFVFHKQSMDVDE